MADAEVERLRRREAELEAEIARLRATAVSAADHSGARRYQAVFESAVDFAIIASDRDGRVTDWNTGAERILGWLAEEMRGEPTDCIFTPEDRAEDRPAAERRRALELGRANNERWHVKRDGTRFWASGELMPLRAEDGTHLGYIEILRDRTEQRRAQEALRESETRFRVTFEQVAVGVAHVGLDGRWLRVNARFCAMLGYTEAELLERTFQDMTHPDDLQADLDNLRALIAGEVATYRTEKRYVLRDGTPLWINLTVSLLHDAAGAPRHFISVIEDISARKAAEAALRSRAEEFQTLADNIPTLCWMAHADGYIHWYNRRWYEYTGTSPESQEGWGWESVHDPAILPEVVQRWRDSLATGEAFEMTFPLRGADGVFRPFLTRIVAIRGEDSQIVRWFGTNTDITEQRAAEQALRELTETLELRVEERTRDLMQTEERLRQSQKMEAVGQLTGGLAHDFNNLLTGITGSLERMQVRIAQGRIGDVDHYVAAAQGAAKRAAALTHRLLAFSRRQTLDPKPTDINRLVAGMEELIRRTAGPAVTVEVVAAGGLWPTLVDPNQLENALLNLCINARDAMPDGGRLTIETGNKWLDHRAARERDLPPGQYVSLCVSDNGIGMAPEVVKRAFDPFFTTKPIGMGTGLGLSMVYGFARQSGGQVRIYSEVGQGTMVCLYLPRRHGQAGDGDGQADAAEPPRNGQQGRTVLVVDDEPTVRMLVTEVLEDLGFTAIEAEDGAAGLRVLQSEVPLDLLITDVGLPGGMNGRQVADAGRVARPGLKVLFITGYAENAAIGNGHLDHGMQVLTKPFAMEALASRIADLIAQA